MVLTPVRATTRGRDDHHWGGVPANKWNKLLLRNCYFSKIYFTTSYFLSVYNWSRWGRWKRESEKRESGQVGAKKQGWTSRKWTTWHEHARVENAGVDKAGVAKQYAAIKPIILQVVTYRRGSYGFSLNTLQFLARRDYWCLGRWKWRTYAVLHCVPKKYTTQPPTIILTLVVRFQ